MPATEQTWRNLKTMHVVFAASSLAMLFATIAMLTSDHNREWKPIQQTERAIETWMAESRIIEQKTDTYLNKHDELARALTTARVKIPDENQFANFKSTVKSFAADWNGKVDDRLKEGLTRLAKVKEIDFSAGKNGADNLLQALPELIKTATEKRAEADKAKGEADKLWKAWLAANEQVGAAEKAFSPDVAKIREAAAVAEKAAKDARTVAQTADASAVQSENTVGSKRDTFVQSLRDVAKVAKQNEDGLTQAVKFRRAEYDEAKSAYDAAIGKHLPDLELKSLADKAKKVEDLISKQVLAQQESKEYRLSLEKTLRQLTDDEDKARKAFDDNTGELTRLEKALAERAVNPGKKMLEFPVLDAFGRPLKIDQIWLPNLTINNNFKDVPRFDRCTTCHQAIDKTAPGSAIEGGYPSREKIARVLTLVTPTEPPKSSLDEKRVEIGKTTKKIYGLELAPAGLVEEDDATIDVVWPGTPAAEAGLQAGDVIESIQSTHITNRAMAESYLLEHAEWGKPLQLKVLRGLPQPYSSHPRLDLYLGSLSPHPLQKFGCTICHDGSGGATAFKFASHTPNDPEQQKQWATKYGWFQSHDWIFPMFPHRFEQSGCLKCHHEVVELEPSAKFPEPPAPQLVEGYNTIRRYGCFGCHEINGYDGPNKRIGPDLRLEPNFHAAALQLKADPNFGKLGDEFAKWIDELVKHPEKDEIRYRIRETVLSDKKKTEAKQPENVLSAASHKLEAVLKDVEAPGKLRKPGPSLRYIANKVDFDFLYSWIANPTDFRPSSKMPRFFGLHDHLKAGAKEQPWALSDSQRYEPIEVRAAAEFLLGNSQPFEYLPPATGSTEGNVESGKRAFQQRGCLACHTHADFRREGVPESQANQGPDLSRIGAKLKSENKAGFAWLYSWVKEPNRYHARTVMPNLFLDPITSKDGKVSDPALDITAYLAASQQAWKPTNVPSRAIMSDEELTALKQLATEYLREKFPVASVDEYLVKGIPPERASELKGDEGVMVRKRVKDENPETVRSDMQRKTLEYVGRRTVGKYGCAGCHDIPGYEDSKPIGTSLADWGRKDPAKLAFLQIGSYIGGHGGTASEVKHDAKSDAKEAVTKIDKHAAPEQAASAKADAHETHALSVTDDKEMAYFVAKLLHGDREGFLWQKLREPRSYDFMTFLKTDVSKYNTRLRMPKFTFAVDEKENQKAIESVMTFVLGLVSEPAPPQYIYNPGPSQKAIVRGRQVLEKFNCGGCHTLEMARWTIKFPEKTGFPDQPAPQVVDFGFLNPHFTPEEIDASLKTDRRGRRQALLEGSPIMRDKDLKPSRLDEDGQPISDEDKQTPGFYTFNLYKPTLINGKPYQVGVKDPLVPEASIEKQYPAIGGNLARLLYPTVVAEGKKLNPNLAAPTVWGWLPPPLIGEGKKVQTKWLHDFLLDPYPIRPAVVLRMPKFNMSSEEAGALAAYFSAVDGSDAPYEFNERGRESHLAKARSEYQQTVDKNGGKDRGYLDDAMKLVTNNDYCVKCHSVADFKPPGDPTALAPNLAQVQQRLRPEYLRRWIGNPARTIPYTVMPVNIKAAEPAKQELFIGDSQHQLDSLVDLLLNFDQYAQEKLSLKDQVKPAPATPPAEVKGSE